MMDTRQELNHTYVLHGRGGITTVQTRLAEYGLCNFVLWNPSPPDWRFRYLTYLKPEELKRLLADVTTHYGIRLYQDTAVYQKGFAGA